MCVLETHARDFEHQRERIPSDEYGIGEEALPVDLPPPGRDWQRLAGLEINQSPHGMARRRAYSTSTTLHKQHLFIDGGSLHVEARV